MTYFNFLMIFIVFPILVLGLWGVWNIRKNPKKSGQDLKPKISAALGIQMILALLYTTPWDNYMVATHIWYYNPRLVSGVILAYVPIEEYSFFLLETLLVGMWWGMVAGRTRTLHDFVPSKRLRIASSSFAGLLWLFTAASLLFQLKSLTYLSIILFWALPAMLPQLIIGADILWHRRSQLAWTILPVGFYLSATDSLAIRSGIWTIDPAQSTRLFMGSLPLEEAIFFLMTATLVSFGMTLLSAEESRVRWLEIKKTFKRGIARMSA